MLPTTRTSRETDYLKFIYLIFGIPKIGKSTILSKMGKVLVFATEPGHKSLEIFKYEVQNKKTGKLESPTRWIDFKICCKDLVTEDHDFNCLGIDTVDNLWKWCSEYICHKHKIEHESDLGFGKGYALVREEFMKPINYLAQRGMGIIFVSHSKTSEKELVNRKITYTDSTLPGSAAKVINGLCDYILYFFVDVEGHRLIRTKGIETINAGDRTGKLPEIIPMDAELLIEELKK